MYQAFNSDDGKLKGVSREEVERYEAGLKNPLSRMHFPYKYSQTYHNNIHYSEDGCGIAVRDWELENLVAFANLAPLIGKWDAERANLVAGNQFEDAVRELSTAFREAAALIPKP